MLPVSNRSLRDSECTKKADAGLFIDRIIEWIFPQGWHFLPYPHAINDGLDLVLHYFHYRIVARLLTHRAGPESLVRSKRCIKGRLSYRPKSLIVHVKPMASLIGMVANHRS
jgi:hypothetical protein